MAEQVVEKICDIKIGDFGISESILMTDGEFYWISTQLNFKYNFDNPLPNIQEDKMFLSKFPLKVLKELFENIQQVYSALDKPIPSDWKFYDGKWSQVFKMMIENN